MEKDMNPWNMTSMDLAVASTEVYKKTGISASSLLSNEEKTIVMKGIKELAVEWDMSENDIEALRIYLLEKRI